MRNMFNSDSSFSKIMNKIADWFILNILWIFCSIPIVTIGATTTALYSVNLKIINNSLDIFPFLWQNILLEVPSKVRKTGQNPKLSGDNWKVITEDELETINKSLSSLKELFNQRKE